MAIRYYNALGERVGHYNGRVGQTQLIYNDPWGNESEVLSSGTAQEIYLPPVAGRQYAMYMNGQTYFTHANALGSTGMITDQTGAPTQEMLYYPFGWPWSGTSSDARFAGMKPWDPQGAENNFYLTPNRPYDGLYGRWISPDPLAGDVSNPQSLNRYAYVLNNPINLTDVLGLCGTGGNDPPCADNNVTQVTVDGGGNAGGANGPGSLLWDLLFGGGFGSELPPFLNFRPGASSGNRTPAPGKPPAKPPTVAVKAATEFCQDRGQLAFNIPFTKIPVTMSLSFTAVVVNFSTTNDITPVAPALPIPPFVSVGAGVDWTFNAPTTPSASVSVGVGKNASIGTYLTPNGLQGLTVSGGISIGPPVVVSAPPGNACGKLAGKSGG